ncbi:rifamycin-inactivating phosphotransferase [Paraflavitalea pollutisoli]|uniref:rifamycin-inactivating phosphotransferase n=1 Tax=Paraflavitalea pollutisoli TaxID=3034143 RepID=UPI0023EC151C|nr:rifamycin-inactivating phosphotransferase [Paraflavitalea sp. H1-2-19X]
MHPFVIDLRAINSSTAALVGGKAANLGKLMTVDDLLVPDGFCVTTEAFTTMLRTVPGIDAWLQTLSQVKAHDRVAMISVCASIRAAITATPIPVNIERAIGMQLQQYGADKTYAVRSSATAEDLPTASFAGQQDSYLHITGLSSVLEHVRFCWASLFTERAVSYRQQQGFDHRSVQLAVIVQYMVHPQAAGVLFTADPVSGHRKVCAIDAVRGLGDALVSGRVNPDHYRVRNGELLSQQIGTHQAAEATSVVSSEPVLSKEEVLPLAAIGRRIEQFFGCPQDIEWCLADGRFYIVQSRPITSLFPIPAVEGDQPRVYISVGHQQMMTDAMRPLGLSFFLMMAPPTMRTAGGRLFVDVAPLLQSAESRAAVLNSVGKSDPLIKSALETLIARGDVIPREPVQPADAVQPRVAALSSQQAFTTLDPSVVNHLIGEGQASIASLRVAIKELSGGALLSFIEEDMQRLKSYIQGPACLPAIMASMNAAVWINEHIEAWLGDVHAADPLAQSVPNNITAEMGLALLDVADVVRLHPPIIHYLQEAQHDDFLEGLAEMEGGALVKAAITSFLEQYGMRCPGEIDITRTRWKEHPLALVPLLLGNVHQQTPGASGRRFAEGLTAALQHKAALLERLRALPDGVQKAIDTERMIDQLRHFAGYREYPKYFIVNRYDCYKQALLREARTLAEAGILQTPEDIYWLYFEELRAVMTTRQVDRSLIVERKTAFQHFEQLTPPRVMTGAGEIIQGSYQHATLPAGALPGLAVSAGVVEGRARVITDLSAADLQEGDILVTTFTDPSWTPLFVSIKGLVTEVGGLMTHGAVIAREYGLPAVVGVQLATRLIKDGQQIRVQGTTGFVELL